MKSLKGNVPSQRKCVSSLYICVNVLTVGISDGILLHVCMPSSNLFSDIIIRNVSKSVLF